MSSSFIQKRKYTKGYHFDLASKRANSHQPLAISQNHSLAKQIIPVHKKEIPSWEENRKPHVVLDSVSAMNDDLSASINKGVVFIPTQKNILAEDNFIQQKGNPLDSDKNEVDDTYLNLGYISIVIGIFGIILLLAIQSSPWMLFSLFLSLFLILGIILLLIDKSKRDKQMLLSPKDSPNLKILNPNAFIGFILTLGGLLFIFISQFIDLFQFWEYGWIVLLIGILAVLIGGVFGWIGRKEIKKDRTKFYGLLLANISIIVTSLFLLFSALFIIASLNSSGP